MKNVHNSDNNYIYQLPQGTKRKNVYTNDKDKNNIKKIRKNEVYMKWKWNNFILNTLNMQTDNIRYQ